jgi:periplasmic protein CpxP/Spy
VVKGNISRLLVGLAAGVAGVGLLCSSTVVAAQTPPARGQVVRPFARAQETRGPFAGIRMELRGLQLTDAERQQVRDVFKQHQREFTVLARELRDARQARNQAALTELGDKVALTGANTRIVSAETDLLLLRNKVRSEVLQLLTPEQQELARQRRQQAEQRLKRRRPPQQPPQQP